MKYLICLYLSGYLFLSHAQDNTKQQTEILQQIFEIEEFQKYLAPSPRFVSTSSNQSIPMLEFEELKDRSAQFSFGKRTVKIISKEELDELEHNFIIRMEQFQLNDSSAEIYLTYQNARMYYEKNKKVVLNAQFKKGNQNDWQVVDYEISEININISD